MTCCLEPAGVASLQGSCFVTGMTDSDGERLVTLAIAHLLRRRGWRIAVMTPVAADGVKTNGRWTSAHLTGLRQACSFGLPTSALSPYLLPVAASPAEAARAAGLCVDAEVVVDTYQVLATWADAVLVEGAGGLTVPLGPTLRVDDVAARLGLPLVLALKVDAAAVTKAGQAMALAQARQLVLAGWVATGLAGGAAAAVHAGQAWETQPGVEGEASAAWLRAAHARLGVPLLGAVAKGVVDVVAAAACLDASRLCAALGLDARGLESPAPAR